MKLPTWFQRLRSQARGQASGVPQRSEMDQALKTLVVPVLRTAGFKGTFPHFRRRRAAVIDLLTFQFDLHGGGFVIELSRCSDQGITTHWGKVIPANKVRAWDMHPNDRYRLQPQVGSGTEEWFRYDAGNYALTAKQVLEHLPRAEQWWASVVQQSVRGDAPASRARAST